MCKQNIKGSIWARFKVITISKKLGSWPVPAGSTFTVHSCSDTCTHHNLRSNPSTATWSTVEPWSSCGNQPLRWSPCVLSPGVHTSCSSLPHWTRWPIEKGRGGMPLLRLGDKQHCSWCSFSLSDNSLCRKPAAFLWAALRKAQAVRNWSLLPAEVSLKADPPDPSSHQIFWLKAHESPETRTTHETMPSSQIPDSQKLCETVNICCCTLWDYLLCSSGELIYPFG